jgi:type I restriction enzyme M protein
MTETNQKQMGKTLWAIADQQRGAMNADDFRDYMFFSSPKGPRTQCHE